MINDASEEKEVYVLYTYLPASNQFLENPSVISYKFHGNVSPMLYDEILMFLCSSLKCHYYEISIKSVFLEKEALVSYLKSRNLVHLLKTVNF